MLKINKTENPFSTQFTRVEITKESSGTFSGMEIDNKKLNSVTPMSDICRPIYVWDLALDPL